MAEINPPYVIDGTTVAGEEIRRVLEALIPTPGYVRSGELAVTQNGTPNMSVNVAAGEAFILGTEQSEQGMYHVYNDATVNKTIAASDPTNPRNDLVIAKVQDAEYSGATRAWSLAVVTGTPAASPADPAVPANSMSLARVRVDAAVSSIVTAKITDLRTKFSTADADAYTAFTPVLGAASSNPTLGTGGSQTGRYKRVGKMVHAEIDVVFGSSGVAAGSGLYVITLPVNISASVAANGVIGSGRLYDFSTTRSEVITPFQLPSDVTRCQMIFNGTPGSVTSGAPWTWAANDEIRLNLLYEGV